MKEKLIDKMIKRLEDYNIILIGRDNLGDVDVDGLRITYEYLYDVLEGLEE